MPRQMAMAKPQSQYGPGLNKSQYGSIGNVSQGSAGPAPTSKPPTPPQNRFQSGTLNRSKEYRTPPVVAPPQVPSNYAPNYPRGSRGPGQQQYGTLPHPQVGLVQPQHHEPGGGSTMPRLSSNSMRSTVSANSGASSTPPPGHEMYAGYGLTRKTSSSSGEPEHGLARQTSQASSMGGPGAVYGTRGQPDPGVYGSRGQPDPGVYGTRGQPDSVYGTRGQADAALYGTRGSTPPSMARPAQRPPSPPLPTPPPPQAAPAYTRQHSAGSISAVYGTRGQPDPAVYGTRGQPDAGVYGTRGQPDPASVYGTRGQPDSVYMSRGQVQGGEAGQGGRGQKLPSQDALYSSRSKMAEQGYNR